MNVSTLCRNGFTLIELSIVLVIIGLIVGGILTGQDLINAATIRAQIAQIEKYHTAVRTFQNKYGGLPGDLQDPNASSFGFQPRGTYAGEGDGNGILQGNCANSGPADSLQTCGELAVIWEDLSEAGLIDTTIFGADTKGNHYASTTGHSAIDIKLTTVPTLYAWLPAAKMGNAMFIYPYSFNGINYFAVSTVTDCCNNDIISSVNPGMTVQQAYNIDKKIDDALPQSGSVTACYINYNVVHYYIVWAAGALNQGASGGTLFQSGVSGDSNCVPTTTATAYASTNCFDNNNTAGAQTYSLSQNANVQNCALSFRFQ